MRVPRSWPAVRRAAAALAAASFTLLSPAAHAEPLPGGVALGMTVAQLRHARPASKRVARPVRMGGGLVGSWSEARLQLAGVALTPTFFFARGQLQRVEYLAREGGFAAFAALRAWARTTWGAELAADGPEGAYASWSSEDTDAYLQMTNTGRGDQVRLVVRRRVTRDASEL